MSAGRPRSQALGAAFSKSLARFVELRRGEGTTLVRSAGSLFLLVAGHAVLETGRDALLLSRVTARHLGAVYPAVALTVIPFAALTARWTQRAGARSALTGGLAFMAAALATVFVFQAATGAVIGTYVIAGLLSSILIPLYWSHVAIILTATQARRLFGVVAAAGTLGAVTGSSAAMGALAVIPVPGLLLLSAGVLLATIPLLPRPIPERADGAIAETAHPRLDEGSPFADPFIRRVALLVAASTAAFVVLDFFFKWSMARALHVERVPAFVARFYVLTNAAAVVAQLLASRAIVRRLGVAWAVLVTPFLIVAGAAIASPLPGITSALLLKALDGTLRGSLYRTSLELAYLPLPASTRLRAKPFIDGALARLVQIVVGGGLLAGGSLGHLSALRLVAATLGLAGLWLFTAWSMREPYLALLRGAISAGTLGETTGSDALDFESAEALIAHLASEDELVVVGAMNALARRGRSGLIPGLVLLRNEASILVRALALFAVSHRQDWLAMARKLVHDARDAVAMAAARALAAGGTLDAKDLARDERPKVRGYAALQLALEDRRIDPVESEAIAASLAATGPSGAEQRLGILSAMADAPRSERLWALLVHLSSRDDLPSQATAELARAIAAQQMASLAPALVQRLVRREGREAVRAALLSFGTAAMEPLERALRSSPRPLRIHIPNTLARFGTETAAELLLDTVETDSDGLVRYKAIRALGRLVVGSRVKVDRVHVERLAERDLIEHVRLLGLRAGIDPKFGTSTPSLSAEPTERLLVGMLDDKIRQSLERVFRLLKIAHPDEDLHRAHVAFLSECKQARAQSVEFLAALLPGKGRERLVELLRFGSEASLEDTLEQAGVLLSRPPPSSREQALERLTRDHDSDLAALAQLHEAARLGQQRNVTLGGHDGRQIELSTGQHFAIGDISTPRDGGT